MAAGRKTGGRKKGSRNKRTRELEQAKAKAAALINGTVPGAFEGDAHALLMTIYKDPEQEVHRRLDAAKAALPYEKPRLASVQNTGPGDGAIETIVRVIEVPAKEAPG